MTVPETINITELCARFKEIRSLIRNAVPVAKKHNDKGKKTLNGLKYITVLKIS